MSTGKYEQGAFIMTTKEQERTALNKIRNILGTLDADSWVNTAFKGVCDIAQENIDNDFACSPVERVEELENEVEQYREYQKMYKTAKNDAEHYKGEYDALKEAYEKTRKDISEIAAQRIKQKDAIEMMIQKLENGLDELNATILRYCENPESPEFVEAVSARKETKQLLDILTDALW